LASREVFVCVVRFEVQVTVLLKIQVFWNIMPWRLVNYYQSFS